MSSKYRPEPDGPDRELAAQALMLEYTSLREESMAAINQRMLATNFIFAALSVTTAALLGGSAPPLVAGLILFVGVPQLAKAGLLIWLGEYERSQRAGRHLRSVEARVNALVGDRVLSWESALSSSSTHMRYPYAAVVVLLLGTGIVGSVSGVATLWWLDGAHHLGPWGVGVVALLVILVVELSFWRWFMTLWRVARVGS